MQLVMQLTPHQNGCEPSSAPYRFRLIALCACLTACSANSIKPPPPPIVDCEQAQTEPVAPPPSDWYRDGPEWALGLLGILERERAYREAEHRCLDSLRKNKIIR